MTEIRRRRYEEGCIAAHALDLIGDRWALLVARELMLGPRRFSQLRAGLPGISANVLTQRLEELEGAGILLRDGRAYALTAAGEGLWPVLAALCRWGAGQPGHDPRLFISPTALMLSMRAMCARERAGSHLAAFRLGDEAFTVATGPGSYRVTRGAAPDAALRFAGETGAMAAAVYGPAPLVRTAQGVIRFEGDLAEGQAFLDLFSLRP